jgi:hypothetical protein
MKFHAGLVLAVVMLAGGCVTAPQQPISLSQDAIGAKTGRLGVAMTPLPKQDTQVPGASCLLCLAAASMANSGLTAHARTLPYEDLPKLKSDFADLLRKKNAEVTVIEEALDVAALPDFQVSGPNVARKDFSSLQQKYKVDKLLVIDITAIGFIRTYSSYIPTSDPKSLLQGTGFIVNLKNNVYEWYQPVFVTKSADKNWDEPPSFPGLTNAYFQAIELGRDSFLQHFAAGPAPAVAPKASGGQSTATTAAAPVSQNARQ